MRDEASIIRDAFRMIEAAIARADGEEEIDTALDEICDAMNLIEPALLTAAGDLTTAEIGEILAGFARRSERASGSHLGNTREQALLAMVALGEIRRRAWQDGLPTLEWCRRERVRGFLQD